MKNGNLSTKLVHNIIAYRILFSDFERTMHDAALLYMVSSANMNYSALTQTLIVLLRIDSTHVYCEQKLESSKIKTQEDLNRLFKK